METITNAANAAANTASKMIWGESTTTTDTAQSGTEPISGVKGSGTATDPYDGGNKEDNTANTTTSTKAPGKDVQHVDSLVPPPTGDDPTHKRSDSAAQGVTPSDAPRPTQTASKDGKVGGFGNVESSVEADPKSAQQPTQKQQGGDRPKDEPSHEQHKAIKEEKHEAEAVAKDEDKSPSSPAPSGGSSSAGAPGGAPVAGAAAGGAGAPGSLSPPKDETSEEAKQGTGEKYIKSSGEASQGGDFDAAKAGAGREADRLLELKGVDRSSPESKESKSPETSPSPAAKETEKEKTSLSQKLKEKLHISKH